MDMKLQVLFIMDRMQFDFLQDTQVDLILSDIKMPVMDGITMTMEVRKDYDFPIIFLSAKSEDIDKITGLNIGADDYITKPFGSMELLARVRSQLRRYEQILMLKEHAVSSVNREEEIYSIGAAGIKQQRQRKCVWIIRSSSCGRRSL